ncbi:hypothetical protein IGI01_00875 [Bacillus thuringiensis]|nr:hypothetical protein [Bacillus thuringiensis]
MTAMKKRKQVLSCLRYRINIATIVVTIKPITTGKKLRRASSNGFILQMAAAGIRARGINPPPVQIAAICSSAVNVAKSKRKNIC